MTNYHTLPHHTHTHTPSLITHTHTLPLPPPGRGNGRADGESEERTSQTTFTVSLPYVHAHTISTRDTQLQLYVIYKRFDVFCHGKSHHMSLPCSIKPQAVKMTPHRPRSPLGTVTTSTLPTDYPQNQTVPHHTHPPHTHSYPRWDVIIREMTKRVRKGQIKPPSQSV